jgi:hypothetical protein
MGFTFDFFCTPNLSKISTIREWKIYYNFIFFKIFHFHRKMRLDGLKKSNHFLRKVEFHPTKLNVDKTSTKLRQRSILPRQVPNLLRQKAIFPRFEVINKLNLTEDVAYDVFYSRSFWWENWKRESKRIKEWKRGKGVNIWGCVTYCFILSMSIISPVIHPLFPFVIASESEAATDF